MPCAFAMLLLTPLGLLTAFIGAVRGEIPKKYCVIGFFLSLAVFLLPIIEMLTGLF